MSSRADRAGPAVAIPAMQFGTARPGRRYRRRGSVYGFVTDAEGRLLVCENGWKHVLPGGTVDPGETVVEALRRETYEEAGAAIAVGPLVCRATQVMISRKGRAVVKEAAFYAADWTPGPGEPMQAEHVSLWMEPEAAGRWLTQEFQRWALARWLESR